MSARKTERLMNLHIMLLSSRSWMSRQRIRETIEGYHGLDDANFERTFERDKKELREAGIPVEAGSDDPDSTEVGYRIRRCDYEMPAINFTPAELGALGVASQVWQDQVTAASTREGLAALQAAGARPDPSRLMSLQPRMTAPSGLEVWLTGCTERQRVSFGYAGATRTLEPWRLLHRRGQWHVIGFDVDRQDRRQFKLTRMTTAPKLVGRPQAFTPPDEPVQFTPETTEPAIVALRPGKQRELDNPTPVAHPATPAGFTSYEVPYTAVLHGQICALGTDAVALAPPQLVTDVVDQLRGIVERWGQ